MAAEPITVEQAIAAADNAEYLALTVESNNYSETTPNGTVKRTITGMNTDVDGVLATANATISALEQTASDSAAEAAASATEAANSVSGVDALVTQAEGFATNAEASKIAAALSETNASTSETNASTFASNSENSATASALSETNAETFATNASDSATQAEGFKDGAEVAETNAESWAAGVNLPAVTPSDIGKILKVKDDNSGYELVLNTVENYLKANQNLNVSSGTETLPSSTPTDYLAGAEIAYNLYADTAVVDLVVDGTVSGTSGIIYMSYKGDFSSSFYGVQLADGTVSQVGVTIDYDVRKAGYTTVAVDLALADAFKFFVLTPADGKCAEINDEDSLAPAYDELMRNRTRTDVNGTSEGAMGVVYTNNLPIPIYISMSTYTALSVEAFALLVDGIYVAASFESAAVAGGMAGWVGSEVLPGEVYQFVDNDNRRDNVMITK